MIKTLNKKTNRGVSAVIGVILMVAITVAIASTVYVYVSNIMEQQPDTYIIKTGVLTSVSTISINCYNHVLITINNYTYLVYNGDLSYIYTFLGHDISITLRDLNDVYVDKITYSFYEKYDLKSIVALS